MSVFPCNACQQRIAEKIITAGYLMKNMQKQKPIARQQ